MVQPNTIDQAVLDDIVRRIVEVAQPERIILFGSAARGEMGPHSDLDLLVIKGGDYHRRDVAGDIYMNMFGAGQAVDIIVATPEDIERYGDSHPLIYKPALREGRVIYDEPENRVPRKAGPPVASGETAPDDPRAWMRRARSNLNYGKRRIPDVELEDLCFQLQQAAEKAIKAVHIARNIEFPYIHDLEALVELLDDAGETIPDTVREAGRLTKYATITRYPNLWGSVMETDYAAAVAIAEAVVAWADDRLRTYLAAEDAAPI